MDGLKKFLFVSLVLALNTILNVGIVACVSGMVLIKLMEGQDMNRFLCLGISVGVALVVYLHVRYGGIVVERILEKINPKIEKENE